MRGFWADFLSTALHPVRFVIFLGVSILAGITGPFGTFSALDLPLRLAYWTFIIALTYTMVLSLRILFQRLSPMSDVRWVNLVVFAVLALTLTPILIWLSRTVVPPEYRGYQPGWSMGFLVFFVGVGVDFGRHVIVEHLNAAGMGDKTPRLRRRLPPEMRGDILHLAARDHQVDVGTSDGVFSIRMRLTDAIAEMEGIDGISTHRSHWVARAAIAEFNLAPKQGRAHVVLINGTEVPVSQKYATEIKALAP